MLMSLRAQLQAPQGNTRPIIAAQLNTDNLHDSSKCNVLLWVPRSNGTQFLAGHASGNIVVYKKVTAADLCVNDFIRHILYRVGYLLIAFLSVKQAVPSVHAPCEARVALGRPLHKQRLWPRACHAAGFCCTPALCCPLSPVSTCALRRCVLLPLCRLLQ